MDVYSQIAVRIIQAQETIIGPVAVEQATRVPHMHIDWAKTQVSIDDGNQPQAINALVMVYQELFGLISKEVSKEAVASLLVQLPADQLPEALK